MTKENKTGLHAVFMTAYEVFHGPASAGPDIRYAQIPARQMVREILLPALLRARDENWEGEGDDERLVCVIDGVEYRWRYRRGGAGGHLSVAAGGATLRLYL